MCAVFSLWLQMGHGNTETALKVENDDDLSALQCCNTHGFAHWMRSKHFHMTPVFPVSISQWAWGAKSSFKQKPGIKLRLQILDNILFLSVSYQFYLVLHTQADAVCVALWELADEIRISSLLWNQAEPFTLQIWPSLVAASPNIPS